MSDLKRRIEKIEEALETFGKLPEGERAKIILRYENDPEDWVEKRIQQIKAEIMEKYGVSGEEAEKIRFLILNLYRKRPEREPEKLES